MFTRRLEAKVQVSTAHLVMEHAMAGHSRLALSQSASLVKNNGLDLVGPFQGITPLDENATGGGHPCTHHDSGGGGQAQSTGAGYYQH